MNRCGPSRRLAQNASPALGIFVRHPKKTSATISAQFGHGAMSDLGPLSAQERQELMCGWPAAKAFRALVRRLRPYRWLPLAGPGLGSHFSCGLQRPAKKWVFSFLRQSDELIAIRAIDLKAANAADLFAKDARAARTPDLDLVVRPRPLRNPSNDRRFG
jgi:hypothetical protein